MTHRKAFILISSHDPLFFVFLFCIFLLPLEMEWIYCYQREDARGVNTGPLPTDYITC